MKKFLSVILMFVLLLTSCSCVKDVGDDKNTESTNASEPSDQKNTLTFGSYDNASALKVTVPEEWRKYGRYKDPIELDRTPETIQVGDRYLDVLNYRISYSHVEEEIPQYLYADNNNIRVSIFYDDPYYFSVSALEGNLYEYKNDTVTKEGIIDSIFELLGLYVDNIDRSYYDYLKVITYFEGGSMAYEYVTDDMLDADDPKVDFYFFYIYHGVNGMRSEDGMLVEVKPNGDIVYLKFAETDIEWDKCELTLDYVEEAVIQFFKENSYEEYVSCEFLHVIVDRMFGANDYPRVCVWVRCTTKDRHGGENTRLYELVSFERAIE